MGGRDRPGDAKILSLLKSGGQILCARHLIPLLEQFSISPEDEDVEIRRPGLPAELGRRRPIKIRHGENVASGITCNFLCIVSCLKPLRLFIKAMPHQHGCDLASDPGALLAEMENRNHSINWISETIIGNTVTNGARLVRISSCSQG